MDGGTTNHTNNDVDDNNNNDNNNEQQMQIDDTQKPKTDGYDFDFRALADQVLRSLDDEYTASVVGVAPTIHNTDIHTHNNHNYHPTDHNDDTIHKNERL